MAGFYARKGTFALQLAAFAKKAGDKADAVVRKVVIDIGTRIVERSPVGDAELWQHPAPKGYIGGRFRANWQYGNYAGAGVPMGTIDAIDPSGAMAIGKLNVGVPLKAAGIKHVILNHLPYAQRLEDGWSTQAPSGMVMTTVVEFQELVRNAVAGTP